MVGRDVLITAVELFVAQDGEMARLRTQNTVLEGLCRRLRSGMVDSHVSPVNNGTDAVDRSPITAHA